ncbi:MAG: hypothetical protein IPJ84_09605 [Bdellovibrionales bacterium]|nr:hypothetical protein [Bdellovibrionales bacterium]
MKSVLQHFVCTLIVTFFAQDLFALSREWVAIDLPGVDRAWKNADSTATYVDHLDPETFPLSKADVEHALRGIYLVRKASMEKLGFKNIVFSFYETELRNNRSQLYIAGHYLQPDGVGIHFLEVHIAEPGRFSHISLLRPLDRTKQRLDRSELLPFINETNPHKRTPASDELSALNECLDCYQCDDEKKTFTANFRALNEVAVKASVASKSPDCQKETFLYNPETASMLDTLGIGYKGSNPLIHGSRAAISCLYGGAKGAFGSVKDLVMLIPKFLSFSAKQLKAAGNAISNFEAPDVSFQKIWKNISPQKIKDSVGNAVQVSSDTLVSTNQKPGPKDPV